MSSTIHKALPSMIVIEQGLSYFREMKVSVDSLLSEPFTQHIR